MQSTTRFNSDTISSASSMNSSVENSNMDSERVDVRLPEQRNKPRVKKAYFVILIIVLFIIILLLVIWRMRKTKPEVSSSSIPSAIPEKKEKKEEDNKSFLPTNIMAETENGTIKVKWDDAPGVDQYVMYYSNSPAFKLEDARIIQGIPKGGFNITKVPPGKYYYRIGGVKGGVKSILSEEGSIEVGKCSPPEPPKNIEISYNPNDPTEAKVSWKPVGTADGYILYVNAKEPPSGTEKDTLSVKIESGSISEHSLNGVTSGDWYVSLATISNYCGISELSESIKLSSN